MNITPGKLVAAREQFGKFAKHVGATYGRSVHVLHHEGGLHYRHWLVVGFDSVEQYEEVQVVLATDAVYGQWSMDVLETIDARTIETNIGRYL